MKPFNLEEAIELHKPVVTRDGRDVWLAGYNPRAEEHGRILGWVDGNAWSWREDGYHLKKGTSPSDLFMKSTEKYVGFWTYLNNDGVIITHVTGAFDTEEKANQYLDTIVKVEFWNDIQNRQVIKINI